MYVSILVIYIFLVNNCFFVKSNKNDNILIKDNGCGFIFNY